MKKLFALLLSLCTFAAVNAQTQQPLATLKSSGYAPVNGLKLYYEIHGEGEPIVLLHGSFMTINLNWSQLIPELAKTRKVIALEMQGHGHTGDIDRKPTYPALADDVAGLLKHLKIDSADVLGYSLGGTVAFQLAIAHPKMVKKLVALSTVYKMNGWRPEAVEAFKTFTPDMFDGSPLKAVYESVAPKPGDWKKFVTKYMQLDQVDFNLGENNIKGIKAPVLLIMGDNDGVDMTHKTDMYRLLGGDIFADMAGGVPKSRLAIFPATGHVTLMMETEKIMNVTTPFLNNTPPAEIKF
ncbi:alpha/beta hydrolase [Chitinophaga lutea]|uniref:Alpha/beta hydrolase n=1 Tax=Chitinophaga lutea TaxID=2488634 RepID=A0A3N4PYU8_9BACT|nr:alpha/beta hydrolase [Chitinophaga lutea]RPE13066.1 alpha/beta hydrolase [Chitinophaga lutea]